MTKAQIAKGFSGLQEYICNRLGDLDQNAIFSSDDWKREEGGGGTTRTIKEGAFIEKGGVAFSKVYGPVTEKMAQQLKLSGTDFFATGVSVVLHSGSANHPIIHMNVRYFEIDSETYWFGGGIDLTPIYIDKASAKKFHKQLKEVCDRYDSSMYPEFKKWADRYFYLPHRKETRGVGGIFFDQLRASGSMTKDQVFQFCIDLGQLFPELYKNQLNYANDDVANENANQWQLLRRSRYVEFNLLHDRGTKFGIYSGGRTESILMSMPPMAKWEYNYIPKSGTPEHQTQELLQRDVDWITL
jgi:coproporphyrinogen III oxidase